MDEGYIKFNCRWIKTKPYSKDRISEINDFRDRLYKLGLIGAYSNGVGFGNISQRIDNRSFLITGSATGNLKKLNKNHYVEVTNYDLSQNSITCTGPIKASSESLSHAAVYECSPDSNAVIHVHNIDIWKNHIHKIPTTKPDVLYGTPEMANEIKRLFKEFKESKVKVKKTIVMGGHKEGIICFGKSFDEALRILLKML